MYRFIIREIFWYIISVVLTALARASSARAYRAAS
jgi:hypothetical protein